MALSITFTSRSRLPYAILGCFAACALLHSLWEQDIVLAGINRQLTFLDLDESSYPSSSSLSSQSSQFQSLGRPSGIDSSVADRFSTYDVEENKDSSLCDDVLLYMPHDVAFEGHGRQLNSYLLAAMMATYTNKAMVMLDTATPFKTNSQFGCPKEAWLHNEQGRKIGKNKDFIGGLSRLIKHPTWLSSDCPIPCPETYKWVDWDTIRTTRGNGPYYPKVYSTQEVRCVNNNGRGAKVLVVGGEQVRDYFEGHLRERMIARPNKLAYGWAMRLGAQPEEAEKFEALEDEKDIWDFVSALMARSGLLEFQPWIARDVENYIRQSELPLDASYDAIHVRRANELEEETNLYVEEFWHSHKYFNPDHVNAEYEGHEKFVPFLNYLRHFQDSECQSTLALNFGLRWISAGKNGGKPRVIYIATNNPDQIRKEIDTLPKDAEGNTIMDHGCHKFKFIFTPEKAFHRLQLADGLHLTDGPADKGCEMRYTRNIACIADMMIAAKSDTFVGELDSNWGRLVRIFRMQLNNETDSGSRVVLERTVKAAMGDHGPLPPGM